MKKFHFICQRWFAVEKDDGKVERLLIVANEIEKHQFSYVLSKRAYHNVSDDYLLFSIFSPPPSVQFMSKQNYDDNQEANEYFEINVKYLHPIDVCF
jgi:polycystin 1L2